MDHILHNAHITPERIAFLEYKDQGALLSGGQAILRRSLLGDWANLADGRRLTIRFHVLWPSDASRLADITDWVWPPPTLLDRYLP